MALGYTSQVINGQLVPVAPEQAFNPLSFGQAYAPSGMWQRQGVYQVPPVMPSASMQSSMVPSSFGSSGFPMPTATSEAGNPFHPTKSPLWWGLGFLIIGILMLQHIHYK
jgi:hypothetical protein